MMAVGNVKRLDSLDLYRGLIIAAMIVVNNPGSANEGARFAPLSHAPWHGCNAADLIFSFFVFIIGVTTVLSLGRRVTSGQGLLAVYKYIFWRTLTLLGLGLFTWLVFGWLFQSICPPAETQKSIWAIFISPPTGTDAFFYSLGNLRLPGVLQRLALVYLAVSILTIHTRWRTQAIAAAALLLSYWALMTLPGFELRPGQDLGALIDRAIFGTNHLYMSTWDPEGLLSTLPAIATGLIGALSGQWLLSARPGLRKVLGLVGFGCLGIIVGGFWGLVFPLNKSLWNSSYALYSAGFAMTFLGVLYWLADLKGKVSGARPLFWLGRNPLLAYCGSQVGFMALYLLYYGTPAQHTNLLTAVLNGLFGPHWDSLNQTGWSDPRWPSLFWALICLAFWTAMMGLISSKPTLIQRLSRMVPRERILAQPINFWDADHIAAGYLGG
jgi:predicted acyltransferase